MTWIDAEDAEAPREAEESHPGAHRNEETDSPVYTFLPTLCEPTAGQAKEVPSIAAAPATTAAIKRSACSWIRFTTLGAASTGRERRWPWSNSKTKLPGEPFILQQLARPPTKASCRDSKSALEEAREHPSPSLHPRTSNDPETLGIWGAIHKRLWELDSKPEDLERVDPLLRQGFYLKDDHYNGINYAFMLNVRASVSTV